MPNLYLALTHYPVVNKHGDTIASAVTSLDLHDLSRLSVTYGLTNFYVVTPLSDQRDLIQRIVSHWTQGCGAQYNPARRTALETIRMAASLTEAANDIARLEREYPKTVATCARCIPGNVSFSRLRAMMQNGRPYLLIFGTAWGLSQQAIADADYVLEPVKGASEYNHLSVRSAAAIIVDRLLADEQACGSTRDHRL
jgi:hypothetical protein